MNRFNESVEINAGGREVNRSFRTCNEETDTSHSRRVYPRWIACSIVGRWKVIFNVDFLREERERERERRHRDDIALRRTPLTSPTADYGSPRNSYLKRHLLFSLQLLFPLLLLISLSLVLHTYALYEPCHGLGFFKRIFSNVKIEQSSDKFGKKRRRHNWFMSSVRGWMNKKNFRFSTIFMERERDGSRNSGTRLSSIRNGKRYSRVCVLTQWQSNSVYVGQAWEEATSLPIVHP